MHSSNVLCLVRANTAISWKVKMPAHELVPIRYLHVVVRLGGVAQKCTHDLAAERIPPLVLEYNKFISIKELQAQLGRSLLLVWSSVDSPERRNGH